MYAFPIPRDPVPRSSAREMHDIPTPEDMYKNVHSNLSMMVPNWKQHNSSSMVEHRDKLGNTHPTDSIEDQNTNAPHSMNESHRQC